MARLAKELVQQRDAFVTTFVTNNAKSNNGNGPTAVEINEALGKAFGGVKMRPQQVYGLKEKAMKAVAKAETATPTTAGRNPGKMPPKTIKIAGRKPGMEPSQLTGKAFTIPLDTEIGEKVLKMLADEAGLDYEG